MRKLKAQAYAFLFLLAVCLLIVPNLLKATGPKEPPQALTENERFIYESLRAVYAETDTARDTARAAVDSADTAFRVGTAGYLLADSAQDTGVVAYLLADSAQDTGVVAYALADSAQDSAAAAYTLAETARDSAATAMDTALAGLDMTLQNVTDNGAITTTNVTVAELHTNALYSHFNYDGPNSSASLYFYNDGSPTGASLGWANAQQEFYSSHNFRVVDDLSVAGNDINIGDGGGFSGIKFNPTSTELEFWIDGSKVGHIGTDGAYIDDI